MSEGATLYRKAREELTKDLDLAARLSWAMADSTTMKTLSRKDLQKAQEAAFEAVKASLGTYLSTALNSGVLQDTTGAVTNEYQEALSAELEGTPLNEMDEDLAP